MQIKYVKISYKEVHIYRTNFAKKMEQLVGGKHMENDCFPRTLKIEMILMKFWKLEQGIHHLFLQLTQEDALL
jgi:hypothetical protein